MLICHNLPCDYLPVDALAKLLYSFWILSNTLLYSYSSRVSFLVNVSAQNNIFTVNICLKKRFVLVCGQNMHHMRTLLWRIDTRKQNCGIKACSCSRLILFILLCCLKLEKWTEVRYNFFTAYLLAGNNIIIRP